MPSHRGLTIFLYRARKNYTEATVTINTVWKHIGGKRKKILEIVFSFFCTQPSGPCSIGYIHTLLYFTYHDVLLMKSENTLGIRILLIYYQILGKSHSFSVFHIFYLQILKNDLFFKQLIFYYVSQTSTINKIGIGRLTLSWVEKRETSHLWTCTLVFVGFKILIIFVRE